MDGVKHVRNERRIVWSLFISNHNFSINPATQSVGHALLDQRIKFVFDKDYSVPRCLNILSSRKSSIHNELPRIPCTFNVIQDDSKEVFVGATV